MTASHGCGYATTPFRVEYRPTYGPHSREQLLEILDVLADCGVKAWWYSAAAKGSYPLFKSQYLPCRDDAVDDLPWLVEEGHRRGISMFSWEYLSTSPLTAQEHPDWRWRFFDWTPPGSERDRMYVCYNSPYGELLKDYTCEVVGDLGFDGVWFDGAFLHGNGATADYACCCDWCAAKYRRETGEEMPHTVDFRDLAFRRFIEWRYHDHTEYWRALSGYVRERHPEKIIVLNYFNRWPRGPECGSPLRRMAGDAPEGPDKVFLPPMQGMIAAERGAFPQQIPVMVKTLRAINDNYPPEVWMQGGVCASHNGPPFQSSSQIFHAETCATHGGYASFGYGSEAFATIAPELRALREAVDPIAPFIGGRPDAPVAMLVSGATKDYSAFRNDGRISDPNLFWQSVHGMDNLLAGLHVPSEVVLDNMLGQQFLDRFQAVVLPGVECMDDSAAAALEAYVRAGGLLLAAGETGTRTPLGEPREQGVLDDLFGISGREATPGNPLVRFSPSFLGPDFAPHLGPAEVLLNQADAGAGFAIRASARLVHAGEGEVLATGTDHKGGGKRWTPQGMAAPESGPAAEGASILARRLGKGLAVFVAVDLGRHYAANGPHALSREIIARVLSQGVTPPFTTDAPPNVAVNLWQQQNRAVLHLLNTPSDLLRLPGGFHVGPPTAPEDFVPTGPIRIDIPGAWQGGFSPRHPERVMIETTPTGAVVTLRQLDRHAVIVLGKG